MQATPLMSNMNELRWLSNLVLFRKRMKKITFFPNFENKQKETNSMGKREIELHLFVTRSSMIELNE